VFALLDPSVSSLMVYCLAAIQFISYSFSRRRRKVISTAVVSGHSSGTEPVPVVNKEIFAAPSMSALDYITGIRFVPARKIDLPAR
jgi:hypothetical protein